MNQDYPKFKVITLLVLGLGSFGFAPIIVKFATDYSGLLITTVRTVSAFLLLIPVYLYKRREENIAPVTKDGFLVALSGFCLGIHFMLWIGSLYFTSVASASILVTIHPIILIVAERALFRVKFASTIWVGVIIAFMGSVLLGISDLNLDSTHSNPLLGNLMAFSGALVFAVYFLIGRRIRQNRTWIGYVFPVYGYAALITVIVYLLVEGIPSRLPVPAVLAGLAIALGPQILGHGALNYAVKYVSPTILSTLILFEPVFATFLAFFFFDEWPAALSFVAIFITMVGISLTWRKNTPPKTASGMTVKD